LLYDIAFALTRLVPETPLVRSQTAVRRALEAIYDQCDWSWQKGFAGWLARGMVFDGIGTFTTTPYLNTITADLTASMVLNAYTGMPLLTQLQYRNPAFAIYDICAVGGDGTVSYVNILTAGSGQTPGTYTVNVLDNGGPGTGGSVQIVVNANGTVTLPIVVLTPGSGYLNPYFIFSEGGTPATFQVFQNTVLTLDRPWMEPGSGPGQPYYIYQHYFVSPVKDFRKWIAIQDFTNDQVLDFWSLTRADLAQLDPERMDNSIPTNVVPAGIDQRPGSSTYGWQRFELYPWQGNLCPYTLSYRRRGSLPDSQDDWYSMVPEAPITDNMVEFKAKEILLLDKSAEMEAKVPGSGRGMALLAEMAKKQYYEYFGQVFSVDLNLDGENFHHVHQAGRWQNGTSFASMGPNSRLNLGNYPTGSGV
jgi:hypothetical protein